MTDTNLIRVGVLACGRYVHTQGIWGPIIDHTVEGGPAPWGTRVTGMRITHAWDVDRQLADDFGAKYGATVVDDYWDMVGKVDGIILDDFLSVPHFRHLTRPYLEAGVPMFINRPFAFNLGDAREMLDLAAKHDTPILSASSFEFAPEVEHIRQQIAACQPLSGYCAANSMSDYATHGVHGVFFIRACIDDPVRRVSYQTRDWRVPNGVLTFEHEPADDGKPYYGCLQETTGSWAWIRAFGPRGFEEKVHPGRSFWPPLVLEMQRLFQTREMPQTYEQIYAKTQMFLAGFKSHVECGGAPVDVDDIGDWTAPLLEPGPYPDGFFES